MPHLYFKFCVFALFLFFISFSAGKVHAQTIYGVVVDHATKEPLPGASVTLQEQNASLLTNSSGYFEFKDLKDGSYTLVVHEIGLGDATITRLVRNGTSQKVIVEMSQKTSSLKEVVVTGRIDHESEAGSRNREKNANNVINVVSAETIKKSPDLNVADVAQRMSGITLLRSSDTKEEYVVIRGLSPRYNNTLINGIKIPSPDDKSRSVPLEIIPSDLVGNLVISKSLTPDMEADAVGGTVDIQLKDAPTRDLLEINLAGGFNQKVASNKFFSYDLSRVQKLDPSQRFGHSYLAVPADFPTSVLKFTRKSFAPNSIGSFSFGKRFLKNKLGFVFSASDQNLYSATTGTVLSVLQGSDNLPYPIDAINRNFYYQSNNLGISTKVDYKFNERNKLSLLGTFFRSTVQQASFFTDTLLQGAGRNGPGTGLVDSLVRSRYSVQHLSDFVLQGTHILSPKFTLDYTLSYADARAALPDEATLLLYNTLPSSNGYIIEPNATTHTWQRNFDKDYSGYFNGKWKPLKNDFPFELKFGGLYRSKSRTNYENTYILNAVDQANQTAAYYSPNFNENTFRVVNPSGAPTINPNNYAASEQILSGYVMGTARFRNLLVVAGLRNEYTNQSNHNNNTNSPFNVIYHYFKYNDLFPSLNLKYELTPNQAIRASYFRGINRPNYTEIVQYTTDNGNGYTQGNPNLKPSYAQNFDLRYEYFPGLADALFLGVFYKDIKAPIERYVPASSSLTTQTFVNGNNAKVMGFEAELVKYAGIFGISGNYTFTYSSELRRKSHYEKSYDAQGNYQGIIDTQPLERTPLEGQSKHAANVALLYRDQRHQFNAQFSVLFQGRRIDAIQKYQYLDYYQRNYTTLSFSADKSIGKWVTVYLKASNLNNAPYLVKTENNYFLQRDNFGQEYLLGIRCKFL